MANGCTAGTLDDGMYSAPVPIIGLYIAAGSVLMLWFPASDIKLQNDFPLYRNNKYVNPGSEGVLDRLKSCYLYGFFYNPQLRSVKHVSNSTIAGFSLICCCVLIQAVIRSLILRQIEPCGGSSSAYSWSIWFIIISQIVLIVLGCSATTFRWFTFFPDVDFTIDDDYSEDDASSLIPYNLILGASPWNVCGMHLKYYLWYLVLFLRIVIMVPATGLFKVFSLCKIQSEKENHSNTVQELKHLISGGMGSDVFDEWTYWKVADNIHKWMELSTRKHPEFLLELLSRVHLSERVYTLDPEQEGIKVNALTMTLLVRLAAFSLPTELTEALTRSFDEIIETITFIQIRINTQSFWSRMHTKLAKAVLIGNGFEVYFPQTRGNNHSESPLQRANAILRRLTDVTLPRPKDHVDKRIGEILNLINSRKYESIEELYHYIEQLYVDMLHIFLGELPKAISKELTDSPAEEFEESAGLVLKLFLKMKSLEGLIQWSFPDGNNILYL